MARACNHHTSFLGFSDLFAILAAAFLLVSCEPTASSGARKKTEAQALQAETGKLEQAITEEIDARKAYVEAVPVGEKPQVAWLLLRRIVVLGQAPRKSLAELLKEWQAAKKVVEDVQKKIDSLIAELKSIESETAKQSTRP